MVKALDLSSNGRMSAWVRTPPLVYFSIFFLKIPYSKSNNITSLKLIPPPVDMSMSLVWLTYSLPVYMLSMGVCTTRHWQTSGGLVMELTVCTVPDVV